MDWTAIAAVGALVVAILAMGSKALDKSLSIREHEEFRDNVNRSIEELHCQGDRERDLLRQQTQRDFDSLTRRVETLEQTRPTTGELLARLGVKDPQA